MAKRRRYHPINADKYNGVIPPLGLVLKSSWEEHFANIYCDMNPACLEWVYEPWKIPYRCPVTDRQTVYIPDFLMSIRSNGGRIKNVLVEIKPLHEYRQGHARNMRDSATIARNLAKAEAAQAWCSRRSNIEYVVLTEAELFPGGEHLKPRKRPVRAFAKRRVKKK